MGISGGFRAVAIRKIYPGFYLMAHFTTSWYCMEHDISKVRMLVRLWIHKDSPIFLPHWLTAKLFDVSCGCLQEKKHPHVLVVPTTFWVWNAVSMLGKCYIFHEFCSIHWPQQLSQNGNADLHQLIPWWPVDLICPFACQQPLPYWKMIALGWSVDHIPYS